MSYIELFILSAERGLKLQPEKRMELIDGADLFRSNLKRLKKFSDDFKHLNIEKVITVFNIHSNEYKKLTFSGSDIWIYDLLETYELVLLLQRNNRDWDAAWNDLGASLVTTNDICGEAADKALQCLHGAFLELFEAFKYEFDYSKIEYKNIVRNKQNKLELIF